MCRSGLVIHSVMCLYQPFPGPRQRRPDRPDGKPRLRRDLRIAEPRVPQQQDITVSLRQRGECTRYPCPPFVSLHRVLGRGLGRRERNRIVLQQREMLLPAYGRSGLVASQIGWYGGKPRAGGFRGGGDIAGVKPL